MTNIAKETATKELAVLNKELEDKGNKYRVLCQDIDVKQKKFDKLNDWIEKLTAWEEDLTIREKQVALDLDFIRVNKTF